VTKEELLRAEAAYQQAASARHAWRREALQAVADRYEQARQGRNDAVRQALDEGWPAYKLAETLGLTRGRISQIKGAR
jgi:hypothetical protein